MTWEIPMKTPPLTFWKIADRVGAFAACVTLFLAFGAVYCILCPPDPARHVTAHAMPIQAFAKTTLRVQQ
jgi:hypothetical protein